MIPMQDTDMESWCDDTSIQRTLSKLTTSRDEVSELILCRFGTCLACSIQAGDVLNANVGHHLHICMCDYVLVFVCACACVCVCAGM